MSRWPMVPLGEIIQLQRRWIKINPTETYREIGIRSFGKGIFHKPPVQGSVLGNKRLLRIEPGDLVFNNVFAWEGAVALAGPAEAGMIGSHRFVTYRVNADSCSADFLLLFFATRNGAEILLKASPGSAGRNKTLGLERFIAQNIPIPPLAEQRRIVDYVGTLTLKTSEAARLHNEVGEAMKELCRSVIRSDAPARIRPTPMAELVTLREPDVTVKPTERYHFAGVYCFGRGLFIGSRRLGSEFKYPRLTRLRAKNFVYPKLMAWEGALAMVPPECDGLVVSTEYPVFQVHEEKVHPEVLDVHFRTPSVWPRLSGSSTGTNVRRRRLKPADFLRYMFPLPSMALQERLVAIKRNADEIQCLLKQSQMELDVMLSALLNNVV